MPGNISYLNNLHLSLISQPNSSVANCISFLKYRKFVNFIYSNVREHKTLSRILDPGFRIMSPGFSG